MRLDKKPTILVLNRWGDEFADYGSYIDHSRYHVLYISTAATAEKLPSCAGAVRTLPDLMDQQACAKLVAELVAQHGRIDKLMALSEYDLDLAGYLRERFDIPGPGMQDTAKFRDKVVMKESVATAGLRIPQFLNEVRPESAHRFAQSVDYPLIFKPRKGAASMGVHKVFDQRQLESLVQEIDLEAYECEEFIPGDIFHVDGLIQNGELKLFRLSQYINTCLGFAEGIPLGSFMVDQAEQLQSAHQFTCAALKALDLRDSAFHLELILDSRRHQWVFLEIGARVGGGEIPFVIQQTDGVDLIRLWVKIILGETIPALSQLRSPTIGGFAMFPKPSTGSYQVECADSMCSDIPHLVRKIVPSAGQILGKGFSYDEIPGRFHFNGPSSQQVEQAIRKLMEQFHARLRPIQE